MSAYILVQANITDPAKFSRYVQAVTPLVAKFGGIYRIIAGETQLLEGQWQERKVVMHEWPDMQAARRFWASPEYAEVRQLRAGTGEFTVLLIDGCQADKKRD
ncbi:MAG: DUF1330 domain-containing protein [Cellvibrionales bacterium]|nr:DUF1330 domain-containing protein [Cellvibrionales bacterium]